MSHRHFLAASTLALAVGAAAAPLHKRLLSVSDNSRVDSWSVTSREAAPGSPVAWSIRKETLHGGKQEGVEVVTVDNGRLRFRVCPTRGMGILSVQSGATSWGWQSPVKEIVHPSFVNLQSRGGLGWLDGFNEWMCRCGLESNGGPGQDRFINNLGAEATLVS